MSFEIETVSMDEDLEYVATLAKDIWTDYYVPIIGEKQVEYMLIKFQSSAAIKSQITEGAEYYLIKTDDKLIGYAGLVLDESREKILLSKLYVSNVMRGKGAGKALLDFIEIKCLNENISFIWLTVNKMNNESINWYKRQGFVLTDEVKSDIGNGFFMDDYIMEKRIQANT